MYKPETNVFNQVHHLLRNHGSHKWNGSSFDKSDFCPHCGEPIKAGLVICTHCLKFLIIVDPSSGKIERVGSIVGDKVFTKSGKKFLKSEVEL